MSADRLISSIDQLKFLYRMKHPRGEWPTVLLLPRRRGYIKQFCEDLEEATGGEAGRAPLIFDKLWRQGAQCSFRDLEVHLYDGDDMAVVGPDPRVLQ